MIEYFAKNLPFVKQLRDERDRLSFLLKEERLKKDELSSTLEKEKNSFKSLQENCGRLFPPGHFYSPLPSISEIAECEERIFSYMLSEIEGIDMRENEQMRLFDQLTEHYKKLPYRPIDAIYDEIKKYKENLLLATNEVEKNAIKQDAVERYSALIKANKPRNFRYLLDNPSYGYTDGIVLFCMMCHLKPKKIIEVGSGYSSCMILDTNEAFFDDSIDFTSIEPYPELLISLMRENDSEKINLLRMKLQDVDIELFKSLQANDILLVDSSHVSKIDSDVNRLFFEILPCIESGVYIHLHDIFYPFEYPKEWIYEGRAWNESYMLRAFLLYNNSFRITFFTSFMQRFHRNYLESRIPLFARNDGGSIWIQKLSRLE